MTLGYTAQQIRDAEAPHLAAGEPLMQRAAHGLAVRILELLVERAGAAGPRASVPSRVLVLVGSGDNGGDALFAAAELAASGVLVEAVGVGSRMHVGGREAAERSGAVVVVSPSEEWLAGLRARTARVDVVVDGILGTGTAPGAPALRGTARRAVGEVLAALEAESGESEPDLLPGRPAVVAVDVPSGIDPDTGATADDMVLPATVTVTFGGVKAGLLRGSGAGLAGRIELVTIGIEDDLARLEPEIDTDQEHAETPHGSPESADRG